MDPLHNPISFEAFAHVALNQPLHQLTKYYDEDGEEIDLANTYEGQDEEDDSSSDDTDDTDAAHEPARLEHDGDTDLATDDSPTNTRRRSDIDTDQEEEPEVDNPDFPGLEEEDIDDKTHRLLHDLSVLAQAQLQEQPTSTQVMLASQTADLFKRYAQHGSQARLSESILKYLTAGDEIREKSVGNEATPAKRARLRFAPVDTAREDNSAGEDERSTMKRRAEEILHGGVPKHLRPLTPSLRGVENPFPSLGNMSSGSGFAGPSTSFSSGLAGPSTSSDSGAAESSTDSANPYLHPTVNHILPTTTSGPASSHRPASLIHPPGKPQAYSVTTDHETNLSLASEPFTPLTLRLRWPANLQWPPGLLDSLNRIFILFNHEGNFMLSYLVRKYTLPGSSHSSLPTTTTTTSSSSSFPPSTPTPPPPPHALFRLGITHYLRSSLPPDSLLHFSGTSDPLGLPVETRRLFREFYDSHPCRLNQVEKETLARAANVAPPTVEEYWRDQRRERRAWHALRFWVGRREAERMRAAKRKGRW